MRPVPPPLPTLRATVGASPRRRRLRSAVAGVAAVLAVLGTTLLAGPIGPSAASSGGLGGLDPSFGATAEPGIGAVGISGGSLGAAIALDPGDANSIVIAGSSASDMAVGMLSSSGAEQSQATVFFGANTVAVADAAGIAPSGDVVIAGSAGTLPAIAFLNSGGSNLDPSFDGSGTYTLSVPGASNETGSFSAVVTDGQDVYAVGTLVMNGDANILVARFTGAGIDANFGGGSGYELIPFPANGEQNSAVSAAVLDTATPNGGDLVIAGWLHVAAGQCSVDEGFLGGILLSGALDTSFTSAATQWYLAQADPAPCGNTRFDALTIDDSATTGDSGDIVAAGSQFAAGVPPSGAASSSEGLLAEYAPASAGHAGFTLDTNFDKSGGGNGLLVTGGMGGVNEFNSVGLLANAMTTSDPGLIAAGQQYAAPLGAFQIAVQKYDLNGVLDASFGSSGTTLLQCADTGIDGCGSALGVQATGAIDVGGGLDGETTGQGGGVTTGLAVAQLTDRSVTIAGPSSNIEDSGSGVTPAVFTITVNSPSDPGLTGLPSGLPVQFSTQNGTGRSGSNYTLVSGTVIFPCPSHNQPSAVGCVANQPDAATVTVPTAYPSNATGSASFSLVLVNATGASISVSSASVTIDYPPQTSAPATTTTTVARRTATTTTLPKPPTTPPAAGGGYWLVTSAGSVFSYGDAFLYGSVSSGQLNGGTVVAIAATSDGLGYWLASSTGQVFAFGDAHGHGSVGKKRLSGTIIAFQPTTSGDGYWMVSSTGRVYAFGKAHNYGSVKKKQLNGTITAFATSAGGKGYWLVSSAGPVYAFGKAGHYGGLPARKRSATVVDLVTSASRRGYWLLTSAGRVYAFGRAHNYGSILHKSLNGSAVSLVPTPDFKGYWVTSTQGSIYTFGDAKSYGSPAQANVTSIVGAATT